MDKIAPTCPLEYTVTAFDLANFVCLWNYALKIGCYCEHNYYQFLLPVKSGIPVLFKL